MDKIIGYHDGPLPYKKGDTVRIKKGTALRSTRSGQTEFTCGRTYTVKVNHTLHGRSIRIGYRRYDPEGTVTEEDISFELRSDRNTCLHLFGSDTLEVLLPHAVERSHYDYEDGSRYVDLYIPVDNPSVRWVGSGGYWMEADINDIEQVQTEQTYSKAG